MRATAALAALGIATGGVGCFVAYSFDYPPAPDVADGGDGGGDAPNDRGANDGADKRDAGADAIDADTCDGQVASQSDATNCGVCGRDCLGVGCVQGFCSVRVLAKTSPFLPTDLAVDSTSVYWTTASTTLSQGTVMSADKATGANPRPIPNNGGAVLAVAVDDVTVYWLDYTNRELLSAPKSGLVAYSSLVKSSLLDTPVDVAVDGTNVYWVERGDKGDAGGTVAWTVKDGGLPVPIAKNQPYPQALATDDAGVVYWASSGFKSFAFAGSIRAASTNNPSVLLLDQPATGPVDLALDGTRVFWANSQPEDAGSIQSMMLGSIPSTLAGAQWNPSFIAVDASHVYWADYIGGTIMRANKDGTQMVPLAINQVNPRGVALDDQYVYWANGDDTVVKVAK